MGNGLAREVSLAEAKAKYDAQCKRVLSQKEILAWILRRTVREFAGMDIPEIIACIEGEPEISEARVYPGETNAERIRGLANEDKVPEEGTVYYDIRFYACAPGEHGKIRLIINVESQRSFRPGYEIVTRGIFYGARMISAQLGTEFRYSEYDDIKKVCSIWLCFDAPAKIGNAISEYRITKEDIIPGLLDIAEAYDKLSVVVIALNEKAGSDDIFIGMINTLFMDAPYEDKKKRLETEYHINMGDEMGKEMDIMCNLSGLVEERGIEQGIKIMVSNLLRLGSVSDEDILKASGISKEQLEGIRKECK